MAETVTVPGMGKVDQKYVYGGLALTAGIVGYAWYKRGAGGSDVEIIPNPDSIPATDRTPVVGDSSGSWDTTDEDAITTNGQWTRAAQDHLTVVGGWEAGMIAIALGKYLDRKPLTEREVEVVQAARAAVGDPPQNGPFAIIPASPGTGAPAAAPGNFRADNNIVIADQTRARVDLSWDAVPGSTGYHLKAYDNTRGQWAGDADSVDTAHMYQPLWRKTSYRFEVAAKGGDGKLGPTSTLTVTTP